jgi:GNAT superfamily N-acetyltransferase
MRLRPYAAADLPACLALFDSNVPAYFHPSERAHFEDGLRTPGCLPPRLRTDGEPLGWFYVVEDGGAVVGCGGWFLDGDAAVLNWGIVERSVQRKGIGKFLLDERLRRIRADGRARLVRVKTTRLVQGFFQRAGFSLVREGLKGLADEFPLVELTAPVF